MATVKADTPAIASVDPCSDEAIIEALERTLASLRRIRAHLEAEKGIA